MMCFVMFSSEQLYIALHLTKTRETKINLACIKSYFTLSVGSRCCYKQMLKIKVCWKVISCCVVNKFLQNIGTISMKQRHMTHTLEWLPNYTITTVWNMRSNENIMVIQVFSWLSKRSLQINKNCKQNWTS